MSTHDSSNDWSYKVNFWKTTVYTGKKKTTYYVRWGVNGEPFKEPFDNSTLADSFRSALVSAARKGEPFHIRKGLPASMLRETKPMPSWYEHACAYADMKWPDAAPKSRVGIAETLATVTPVLLATADGMPDRDVLRKALYAWSFRTGSRLVGNPPTEVEPPDELAKAVQWVRKNTVPITAFEDPAIARAALNVIAKKLDGTRAADKTTARKRAVLHAVLEYAVELGYFNKNPLKMVSKKAPKISESVDPAALPDRRRAKALLASVGEQGKSGPRLVAYFACIYYAAMRPGEVSALCVEDFIPPTKPGGWGEFRLRRSAPSVAAEWTDSREGRREARQLKHRARKDFRVVPCQPELAALLTKHIKDFGVAPDGRLFRGARGGPISDSVTGLIWRQARAAALSKEEVKAGVASRPYDLRHACVTGWLNAGVDAAQVAEWAGHSVAVLLRVYVRCIVGRDEVARKRIEAAFQEEEEKQKAEAEEESDDETPDEDK